MKSNLRRFLAGVCVLSLFPAATAGAFADLQGHWAQNALQQGVHDGLLYGSDNQLLPNRSLTGAEMAAILNRVLSAQNTDRKYQQVTADQWYAADAHKGASLGILPLDGTLQMTAPVTRAQVFEALTAAFGIAEAAPDMRVLDRFSDANSLSPHQQRAAAVLVRDGILAGAEGGSLQADRSITRAEFLSLIYRIWSPQYLELVRAPQEAEVNPVVPPAEELPTEGTPAETAPETEEISPAETPAEEPAAAADSHDTAAEPDAEPADTPTEAPNDPPLAEQPTVKAAVRLFQTQPDETVLPRDQVYDRIVLRGNNMEPVFSGGAPVEIRRLTLATTGNDLTLSGGNLNKIDTVNIGGGTGRMTLSDPSVRAVEVTGSGRIIHLNGMQLDSLIITGTANTVIADAKTTIGNLQVLTGAADNKITVDGKADQVSLLGGFTFLQGEGSAKSISILGKRSTVTLPSDTMDDRSDNGLDGVKLQITAPVVQPGSQVTASVAITGVEAARVVAAQWYFDGAKDSSFANAALTLSEGLTSNYRKTIPFTQDMKLNHRVGFDLRYRNTATGEIETVYAEAPVTVINHPDSYYRPPMPDAQTVLKKVNPVYRAGNQDYTQDEKTVFVNAKGYSSPTQYMIWVSLSAQKVNIFQGSQGNWKLIQEFVCATGASRSPTRQGVTYVTYKQTNWTTSSYTCRPIVRFFPNTGYAFHSRLYYPNSNRVKDASMGFPVSAGCVRMMDEGIYWIYNNIPTRTTVVVY